MSAPYSRPVGFSMKPVATSRQRLTIDNTAGGVTLTVPANAIAAIGRLETAQVRFTLDTSAPTTSAGMLLEVGERLYFDGRVELTNFKAIRTGGTSGVLDVEFYTADYSS